MPGVSKLWNCVRNIRGTNISGPGTTFRGRIHKFQPGVKYIEAGSKIWNQGMNRASKLLQQMAWHASAGRASRYAAKRAIFIKPLSLFLRGNTEVKFK